jgi:hypothetical protein
MRAARARRSRRGEALLAQRLAEVDHDTTRTEAARANLAQAPPYEEAVG